MREHKYRAWDKINEAMRDVWSITWDITPHTPTAIIACNPVINSEYILREGQFELMEYTGLKDKNGKEIYEGDEVFGYGYNRVMIEGVVTFSEGEFSILNNDDECEYRINAWDALEIIGNIYEHNHLLTSPII